MKQKKNVMKEVICEQIENLFKAKNQGTGK